MTSIEWTDATWNPVTGCSKVSDGCANCYAEAMALRLQAMGQANYRNGFQVACHPHMLGLPKKWKRPRMVFVNSMADLFHKDVPDAFINQVFQVMEETPHHTYQVLTKRPGRMARGTWTRHWPGNVWAGVSVENQSVTTRVDLLREVPAAVRFLSVEPLLGPIHDLNLDGIGWVIVGGESGPNARPMQESWALSLRDQCHAAAVPFFFKQWGGRNKKAAGRLLQGQAYDAMPQQKPPADSQGLLLAFSETERR